MNERDIGTELTWKLSAILEDCNRIEPMLMAYLNENDKRPEISAELLRILSNALGAYELLQSNKSAGEFHGLPRKACSSDVDPQVAIRQIERPADWDFHPWLLEKRKCYAIGCSRIGQRMAYGCKEYQSSGRITHHTFGWLVQHRRLVRDYEKTECSAAGWIAIALTRVMLRRLA
jgi:hypothetical protein